VCLNDVANWKNVPTPVWDFTIGGYHVIKKCPSSRERRLLGRDLIIEEAKHVTNTARRNFAIVLLAAELDENYRACKDAAYTWKVQTINIFVNGKKHARTGGLGRAVRGGGLN
jgi:hypothetical protein